MWFVALFGFKSQKSLYFLLLCLPVILFGQTTLGQPDIWYSNPAGPFNPNQPSFNTLDLIGNHPVLKQDSVLRAFEKIQSLPSRGLSVFIVVRPLFQTSIGKTYVRFKGLEITDSKILYRGAGRKYQPDQEKPVILSASFPAYSKRGGRTKPLSIDTTMFKVAEIIAFNRLFSKEEMRLMEAYLSLKFSIPTTKNEDNSLRSYPGDSLNTYYWTAKQDKVYDQEVIALGNFSFSGIQQSQTVAYHEDSLIVALDTVVPFGQMPQRGMQEGSVMVLSKRIDKSNLYDCELHLNQQYPLTAWRLRTQNFSAMADSLMLYYPKHQQSAFNDTIILTDGIDTLELRTLQLGSDLSIALSLAEIRPNRVYRFRIKGNQCNDTASIGLSTQGIGMMAVRIDPRILPVELKIQSLNGLENKDTVLSESPLNLKVGEGQYNLVVRELHGKHQRDFLLAGIDKSITGVKFLSNSEDMGKKDLAKGQKIIVYPNPGFTGEMAHLEFHGFTQNDNMNVRVFDPQGRLIYAEEISLTGNYHMLDYQLSIPGSYTFIFLNQDQAFSQKITVQKRF